MAPPGGRISRGYEQAAPWAESAAPPGAARFEPVQLKKSPRQMTQVQKSQLIIEILRRLANELDESAVLVDDLHALVELSARMGVAQDNGFVRSAQSIDILQQRLAGLSHFVSELAELTPSHWVVESHAAAKKLKLSKLAERFSHTGEGPLSHGDHQAGEIELF